MFGRSSLKWLSLGVVLLVLFGAAAYGWHLHRRGTVRSIAVLPFDGGDAIGAGLTREVVDSLRRVPGLRVIAAPKGDPRQTAERFSTTAVLQGTVRRSGDRLILYARLDRPADGYEYWARRFEQRLRSAALIPQDVAKAVAGLVPGGRFPTARPAHLPTPEAYLAYLEGRANDSTARLARATEIDPEFAPAWAWLSMATSSLVEGGTVRPNQAMPLARDAAERAVALDPDSADAHAAMGIVKLQYDWDWEEARREFDRAVQLNPRSPLPRRWLARWFESQNKPGEAQAEMAKARELDPLCPPLDPSSSGTQSGETLSNADALRAERYVPAFDFALLAVPRQDWDTVFQWLDLACDERSPHMPYWRQRVPAPRSDPRYADLEERMNQTR